VGNDLSVPFTSDPAETLFNVATLKQDKHGWDAADSPVLTESSTVFPVNGSTVTIMSDDARDSSPLPDTDEAWNLQAIGGSGGSNSNSGPPACTMFSCLLGSCN